MICLLVTKKLYHERLTVNSQLAFKYSNAIISCEISSNYFSLLTDFTRCFDVSIVDSQEANAVWVGWIVE